MTMSTSLPVGPLARTANAAGRAASDLAAATVVAMLAATFAVSHATLICAGVLAPVQAYAVTAALTTCLVLGLVVAAFSSLRFVSAGSDGNVVAVMAAAAAAVAPALEGAPREVLAATLVTGLALSAGVAGLALVAIGVLRLGGLARYIPFPVIAGFLSATGCFLAIGGLRVGTDQPARALLADPALWPQAGATLAVAGAIFVLRSRLRHPFGIASIVAAAIAVHWAVFLALGLGQGELARSGWLLMMPERLPYYAPLAPAGFEAISWAALLQAAPTMVPLTVVAVISILLNVSALENASGEEADLNRDLTATGLASVASGLSGGMLGYISFNRSFLLYRVGVRQRRVAIASALLVGSLIFAGDTVGYLPRPVMGGLVLYLGLQLLDEYLLRSRKRIGLGEWLTVVAVVLVTTQLGFAAGVLCGLMLGCIHFALAYARFSPIRARYTGRAAQSAIERSDLERRLLVETGDELLVMHVHGFLFFGTAHRLVRQIRADLAARPRDVRHLVLDFSRCDGLDSSVIVGFARLPVVAKQARCTIVLTGLPAETQARLAAHGVTGEGVRYVATLDAALTWCEDERLAFHACPTQASETLHSLLARELGSAEAVAAFLEHLEPLDLAAGEVLIRQGEASDALFFVDEGRASALVRIDDTTIRARTFRTGTLIGEIGFVLGEPRTATVLADTPCRVMRLTRASAERVAERHPDVGVAFNSFLNRRLCRRLLDKDSLIEALVRQAPRPG